MRWRWGQMKNVAFIWEFFFNSLKFLLVYVTIQSAFHWLLSHIEIYYSSWHSILCYHSYALAIVTTKQCFQHTSEAIGLHYYKQAYSGWLSIKAFLSDGQTILFNLCLLAVMCSKICYICNIYLYITVIDLFLIKCEIEHLVNNYNRC